MAQLKNNFEDGDILDPSWVNEAANILNALSALVNQNTRILTINGHNAILGSTINLTSSDIPYDANAAQLPGSIGAALEKLSTGLENCDTAVGVKVMPDCNVDDLKQHGIFFIDGGTEFPDGATRAYVQVLKTQTVPEFFVQNAWTENGGTFSRMFVGDEYTIWKQ